jgi:hypothetical protein
VDGARRLELISTESDVIEPVRNVTIGRNEIGGPVAAEFTGRLVEVPVPAPDCRRFQAELASRT